MIGGRPSPTAQMAWDRTVEADGATVFRTGFHDGWRVVEWPGLARLTCDPKGRKARIDPWPQADPWSLAKLRGVANVMLGDLQGGLGLHASAVALGRRSVVILGSSGAGKSTTAAQLCFAHGGRLLADDAALLLRRRDRVFVVPSESKHYLDAGARRAVGLRFRGSTCSAREKTAVRPRRRAARRVRLGLVVSLGFDDSIGGPELRRLRGAQAAMSLLGAMYGIDLEDRRRDLDHVLDVHSRVPLFEIRRPHRTPDVTSVILEVLRDASP